MDYVSLSLTHRVYLLWISETLVSKLLFKFKEIL